MKTVLLRRLFDWRRRSQNSIAGAVPLRGGIAQPGSAEAGFSILEPLMAIVVLAILMSSVAPILMFSVATRVQARRVELATQAARGYIDMVDRDTSKRPPFALTNVVPTTATVSGTTGLSNPLLNQAAPPNSVALDCPVSNAYCASPPGLFCYNFDDIPGCQVRSLRDVIVQPVRSTTYAGTIPANPSAYSCVASASPPANNCNPNATPVTGDDADQGYRLAVRVYSANAFNKGGFPLGRSTKQASVTAGIGDKKSPIVEFSTEIYSTNTNRPIPLLGDLCKRTRNTTASPNCVPSN